MDFADLWHRFVTWIMAFGMPVVQCYHLFCGNVFINTAAEDAQGLEKIANEVLAPVQYLFVGNKAVRAGNADLMCDPNILAYRIEPRFDYKEGLLVKHVASIVSLPITLPVGCVLKALAYISSDTRSHHDAIKEAIVSTRVKLKNDYYRSLGIEIRDFSAMEQIDPPKFCRRPGDENNLKIEKEALKEVVSLLKAHEIPFWIDCGTLLGAHRYGGVIPWDHDVDLAVLQPDFENVKHALNALDPQKYVVQDWSSRDKPGTYLKVYIKETGVLIDIYHFGIDPEKKQIQYIISNEDCVFMVNSWKTTERRFKVPTAFSTVFPLKKANFDGIEVLVPNKTIEYLQARYGENLDPIKVYDEKTGKYEKDLSHPYWKIPYAY